MGPCQTNPKAQRRPPPISRNPSKQYASTISHHSQPTKFNPTPLFCSSKHQLAKLCISKQCKAQSLTCQHRFCPSCAKLHPDCKHISVKEVTGMIQKRMNYHKELMKKMQDIQTGMIHKVFKNRRECFQGMFSNAINQRYAMIVDAIYHKKDNDIMLQGREANDFCQKLMKSNQEIPQLHQHIIAQYSKQMNQEAEQLNKEQRKLLDQYVHKCKIDVASSNIRQTTPVSPHKILLPTSSEAMSTVSVSLDSHIVTANQSKRIQFICSELNYPKRIDLVFRASEHQFKAAAFHQVCDQISHTLTIIHTQYDKVLACYTPLRWNITQGFASDPSNQSFLLSLNLMQKMSLVNPQKAIQCIPSYGPVFGGGADIALSDSCNINSNSCTNFAYSYNYNGMYKYNQEAWKALCGCSQGKYFKVKEYEVFKIIF